MGKTTFVSLPQQNSHSVNNTTIHEHRAPTDESIRLLKEMSEKASKSVVRHISATDNVLNGEVFTMANPIDGRAKIYFRFSINGKKHEIIEEVKSYTTPVINSTEMLKELYDNVSKHIALELFKEAGFINE